MSNIKKIIKSKNIHKLYINSDKVKVILMKLYKK